MMTLIKNGLLCDGSGEAPAKQDVLIHGDSIVRVGNLPKVRAERTIDAAGAMVIPGLIDINTYSDRFGTLFAEPLQADFLAQGVTTIIGGNGGESLAPATPETAPHAAKWAGETQSRDWHSVAELFRVLDARRFGVNFGTLAGLATLRRSVTRGSLRDMTRVELDHVRAGLASALKAGAFGLSADLSRTDQKLVPPHELRELFAVAASEGAVCAVHARDGEEKTEEAIKEIIGLARAAKARTEIAHFIPREGFAKQYAAAREVIEGADDIRIHFDTSVFAERIVPLIDFLPPWAHETTAEAIRRTFALPNARKRIFSATRHLPFSHIRVLSAPKETAFLEGKTIAELASDFDLRPEEALVKLMEITHMKAMCLIEDVHADMLECFIASPAAILSLGGGAASAPRGRFATRRTLLSSFFSAAEHRSHMPFEQLIRKFTCLPAEHYGIERRGAVKEGYYADIVVLEGGVPHDVFVNGVRVMEGGTLSGVRAGRLITHGK